MLVTWVSRKGGRNVNEDAVGKVKANNILCVAVADGLGGHTGGQLAAKLAVDTVLNQFCATPEFSVGAMEKYIRCANTAIVETAKQNPECIYMSSTIAVVLIKGKRAIWGNVGDSRIYRLRNSRIVEVSEDHSVAFLDFMNGDIEYNDIRTSENQNKLTSALGIAMADINISDIITIDSHTSFLLCTDGWWEYVNEDTIEQTSKNAATSHDWLASMLRIRESNAPENSDNYTAAAIML